MMENLEITIKIFAKNTNNKKLNKTTTITSVQERDR